MEFGKSPLENMVLNKDFWEGKKIFLTGHTGFKGAWLSILLRLLGAHVYGFSLPPATKPNLFSVLNLDSDIDSFYGDIRNPELLKSKLIESDPDIVIHMAAQAIVRESYENPIETYAVNVLGTAHLLEAVRSSNKKRAVICVTSDKCYENREWPYKYRENDPMGGWDPYSASKGCSELVISSYRNAFFNNEQYDKHGVALASVRAGNVIGGGDWGRDRLIPDIMRAFSEKKSVIIRNPAAVRPWQFVLDLLSGYLILAERLYEQGPEFTGAWNFGPSDSDERNVRSIVERVSEIWGDDALWELDPESTEQPHEAFTLKLDSSKSRSKLGWVPSCTIDEVLEYVVDWYKNYYSNRTEMRTFTEEQISLFERQLRQNSGLATT
jgi:CDP-glucose 4,6-dehydratase